MAANPVDESAVDALYEELFFIGKHRHDPVPIDPKAIIRKHLAAAQQQQGQAKDAEIETLKAEAAAQRTRADVMAGEAIKHEARADQAAAVYGLAARLVDELDGLVSESDGVSGLHLNGDVATWEELLPGGRFECLSSLDELREALAAQQQEPTT